MAPPADDTLSRHLGANIRTLRDTRGLTQLQLSKLAGVPRATWANLESGGANPTLSVLARVAAALGVSIEELISPPQTELQHYPAGSVRRRKTGPVEVRMLLPHPIPGVELERMALKPGAAMRGVPHTPGTREYLACERGTVHLAVGGQQVTLHPGDVVVFRGDQRHGYQNPGNQEAVAYSTVLLAPDPGLP